MNWLKRLFARSPSSHPAAASSSASDPSGSVTIDNTEFPLARTPAELAAAIGSGGRAALLFPSLRYREVLSQAGQLLRARYGDNSAQYRDLIPSPLLCARCLWEFPGSYRIGLQMPEFLGRMSGGLPGGEHFARTGECPQCGGTESLLVYECFSPEDVTQTDVEAIQKYWEQKASVWWRSQNRSEAICDACNAAIPRGAGSLSGSSLLCDGCVRRGIGSEGLARLRSDPHYYGAALLRKARAMRV